MREKVNKILEKQLQLLSEASEKADASDLAQLTRAMCVTASYLLSDSECVVFSDHSSKGEN